MCGKTVLILLLVDLLAPFFVQSCSCPVNAFTVTRSDAIRRDYCSSYSSNVYSGMVVAATCNCLPGEQTDVGSSFINCQHYQLESQSIINATILSLGQCQGTYDSYFYTSCSSVGNSLQARGYTVEGPVRSGDDVPLRNLTVDNGGGYRGCSLACSFNDNRDGDYAIQPCVYTVRVMEVFKGSYTVDEEVVETGPDVLTSCGSPSNMLQLSTTYMAGIGGPCSPFSEWTQQSTYTPEELQLLRALRDGETGCDSGTMSTTSANTTGTNTDDTLTSGHVHTVSPPPLHYVILFLMLIVCSVMIQ